MKSPKILPMVPIQYDAVGEQILKWAEDPSEFKMLGLSQSEKDGETNLAALKVRLNDQQIQIPDRIKRVIVIQGDSETFILRLPPKEQAKQSELGIDEEINNGNNKNPSAYKAPHFYYSLIDGSFDMKTFFRSRIGDYTICGCR